MYKCFCSELAASTQTTLSFPPKLPAEIEDILGQYMTQDEPQVCLLIRVNTFSVNPSSLAHLGLLRTISFHQ